MYCHSTIICLTYGCSQAVYCLIHLAVSSLSGEHLLSLKCHLFGEKVFDCWVLERILSTKVLRTFSQIKKHNDK